MELIAGIITFSLASWQIKVKLAFLAFDFDESKTISKEEMVIMVLSFIKGIGILTSNIQEFKKFDLEFLARKCFYQADSHPDGNITLDELTNWVENSEIVMKLFRKTEKNRKKLIFGYNFNRKIKNKSLQVQTEGNVSLRKRASISINFTGRKVLGKNLMRKGTRFNQAEKSGVDVNEVKEIFFKTANPIGYATVGALFETLSEDPQYAEDSDFLFHEFNFEKDRQINFTEFLDYISKRRSKLGYSIQKDGKTYYPDLSLSRKKNKVKVNLNAVKGMFSKFDKNHDGVLSMDELVNGLKNDFNTPAILELFQTYDKDKNKVLDLDEFIQMFDDDDKQKQTPILKKRARRSSVFSIK